MPKGTEFEIKTLAYLEKLFGRLGFTVTESRRQNAGTQNGFDIRMGFLDEAGRERKFYFECKDYTSPLSLDDIGLKIVQLHPSGHRPSAFIAITPHVVPSNGIINNIERLQFTINAPIRIWSPETGVKEFFSLDPVFYEEVYGERPGPEYEDHKVILEKMRIILRDLLRQTDELEKNQSANLFPKELTFQIPRMDPGNLIGRDSELHALHELLFNSGSQVVVLNGMGGIGKTTLAKGYVSKYFEKYAHVAWVTQVSNDFVSDFSSASGLGESLRVPAEELNAEKRFLEALRGMKSLPDGPSLLILDNVDESLTRWKDYLPGKPHWHVLATSRQQIEGFYRQELDSLSPDNAFALFKRHCSLIKDEEAIIEIIEAADYHTLTIEVLAKTAQLQRATIEALRDAIKKDLRSGVYIEHKGSKIDRVRSYLSSIFNCSGLDETKQWVMKHFAYLPAEFHPYELLVELIGPDEEQSGLMPEACGRLAELGWLLYDDTTDAYKMHVIIQEVTKLQLKPVILDMKGMIFNIAEKLDNGDDREYPVRKFKWIAFGYELLNIPQLGNTQMGVFLQQHLARALRYRGDFVGAKTLLEKAVVFVENTFGAGHPELGPYYLTLAAVLRDLGDFTGAKELMTESVTLAERHFGLNHPNTLAAQSVLAAILGDLGDYDGAISLLERIIAGEELSNGRNDYESINNYSNLAVLLQDQGNLVRAKELLEKAVTLAENYYGLNHPHTAICYSNLGRVLRAQNKHQKAKELIEKAVASDELNLGPDHPDTIVHCGNLATILIEMGDNTGAKILLEKTIASRERRFGPHHPDLIGDYSNLAWSLCELADHARAKEILQKAIEVSAHNFGPDHFSTAELYGRLALVYKEIGDNGNALRLLAKALVIYKATLPAGSREISILQNLHDSIKG